MDVEAAGLGGAGGAGAAARLADDELLDEPLAAPEADGREAVELDVAGAALEELLDGAVLGGAEGAAEFGLVPGAGVPAALEVGGVTGDANGVGVVEPSAASPGAGLGRLGAGALLGKVLSVPKSSSTNSSEDKFGWPDGSNLEEFGVTGSSKPVLPVLEAPSSACHLALILLRASGLAMTYPKPMLETNSSSMEPMPNGVNS